MNYVVLAASDNFPGWAIGLVIFGFFVLVVIGVVLVKKHVKPLQIKKPDISEEQAIQEELDRVLIPVDDETQKQMDEAMKKDGK